MKSLLYKKVKIGKSKRAKFWTVIGMDVSLPNMGGNL
jgi:hypothetical protein